MAASNRAVTVTAGTNLDGIMAVVVMVRGVVATVSGVDMDWAAVTAGECTGRATTPITSRGIMVATKGVITIISPVMRLRGLVVWGVITVTVMGCHTSRRI